MQLNQKNITKKLLQFVGYSFAIVLLLLLLLRISFVQTFIAKKALSSFSNKLNTTIQLEKIAINFIDNITLKGLYVEDLQGDTMLYAEKLNVDLGIFKLISGKISIDDISLENTVINIHQQSDSSFSYQFILDAFPTDTTNKSETNINLEIGQIEIKNLNATFNLLDAQNKFSLKKLEIEPEKIDLNRQDFFIKKIDVNGLNISSIWKENFNQIEVEKDTSIYEIQFPLTDLPVSFQVKEILIANSNVFYQKGEVKNKDFFDSNYLNIKDINVKISSLKVNENIVTTNIEKLLLKLNNKINIENLSGKINFTNSNTKIENLNFTTTNSKLQLNSTIDYESFEKIIALNSKSNIDFSLPKLELDINEVLYFLPQLDTIEIVNNLKNKKIYANTKINGKLNDLSIKNTVISLDENTVNLNGKILNATDIHALELENLNVSFFSSTKKLRGILGEELMKVDYDKFGEIRLKSNLNGTLNNLHIQNLTLRTDADLSLNLSAKVENLLDINNLKFNIQSKKTTSSFNDLTAFSDSLPAMLQKLNLISFEGNLGGTLTNYKIDGKLKTDLGNIVTNLSANFSKDYTDAEYAGLINIENFELGKLLENDSIGNISLHTKIKGSGIEPEKIMANIEGEISSFYFNNYEYTNIDFLASANKGIYDFEITSTDSNLDVVIIGEATFLNENLKANINTNVKNIDAEALKLVAFPLQTQFDLTTNLEGKNLNDLVGKINISEIQISNNEKVFKEDSIVVEAKKNSEFINDFSLQSSFINANLQGNFSFDNLKDIFLNLANNYMPISEIFELQKKTNYTFNNETILLNVSLSKIDEIVSFFDIDLQKMDTAYLKFHLNGNLLDAEFFAPEISYSNMFFDSIYFNAKGINDKLDMVFKIDSISLSETMYIPGIRAEANFSNQIGQFKSFIKSNQERYSLAFTTNISSTPNSLLLELVDPFVLDKKTWNVTKESPFVISNDSFFVSNFSLSNNKQKINFNKTDNNFSFSFQNFELNNFSNLVQMDSSNFIGIVDGIVSLNNENELLLLEGNLNINDINLNKYPIGNLTLNATQNGNDSKIDVVLLGNENDLKIKANYSGKSGILNGDLWLNNFAMKTIQPFANQYAKNIDGNLSGKINLGGTIQELETNGNLVFNKVGALIVPLGTYYSINNGNIGIETSKLLPNIVLNDESGKSATLNGTITHNFFTDFKLDLKFNTNEFTFLNAPENKKELIFGKLTAATNLNITGTLAIPKIRGKITALNQTDLTVQLIESKSIANQESFVIFVNGENLTQEEIDSVAAKMYKVNSSVDLNINLEITDKALFRVVIDPTTGDNLEINGTAQLNVRMPPNGDLSINGVYTVNKGLYRFSFQKLLKKRFEIVQGSQIIFAGNPLNARFNLQAAYNTEASALPLVQNDLYSLSQDEKQALRGRSDVSVLLNIKGALSDPIISFDIKLPESGNNPIGNSASQSLNRLKQNESELNKQVFSLLLFNSFTGSNNSSNISSTGNSAAFKSVGNLINNQLNKLVGNAEGLQINFDLDQYENQLGTSDEQITDIDFGISQTLLNDRLVISVGGNVNLESGQEQGATMSGLAGDFVLEYKLTSDGKYIVKVFQKSDYNSFNDANVWKTGVGFSYQTRFGKLNKRKNKP